MSARSGATLSYGATTAEPLRCTIELPPDAHFHLVGIGGSGLSAIARVLLERGYRVSGSDLAPGAVTLPLAALGATIYTGHAPEQVAGADVVLVSSAIPAGNAEVSEARQRDIPVLKRTELLGWLTADKQTIAVAGTHGKTTTTAMIAWLLSQAGEDPSYIIGGVLPELKGNAHAGSGPHFVIEADEYDQTFLGLNPDIALITTVEWDHVDCYPTPQDCYTAFHRFAALVPDDGLLVVCAEDSAAAALGAIREAQGLPLASYGLGKMADWSAMSMVANRLGGSDFSVWWRGQEKGSVSLRIPGQHNVLNSLAALAVADYLGIAFGVAASALTGIRGAERRFERKGEAWDVAVVDDYAHHPTEIRATLSAARQCYPARPIWALLQPHTYSRTSALLSQFAASLADADHVIVTDIYAARECDTHGISAVHLIDEMIHPDARYIGALRAAADFLLRALQRGDVLITLGAGDGYRVGEWVLAGLKEREDAQGIAQVASKSIAAG
jgi:UDP-N-acetylmuramate--alanine ligase